ncbi:MAG: hypothetical protein P8Y10_15435 [Gemmatimonadales bacterium]|jgi:hypothetical protein
MTASRFGRTDRRRLLLLLGLAILSTSMLTAVRRSSEARRLSADLEMLERTASSTRSELTQALVRADSLSSRTRMIEAGAALGLRPAAEAEFEWLERQRRPERIAPAEDTEVAVDEPRQ